MPRKLLYCTPGIAESCIVFQGDGCLIMGKESLELAVMLNVPLTRAQLPFSTCQVELNSISYLAW
jgi:hypothetical protein